MIKVRIVLNVLGALALLVLNVISVSAQPQPIAECNVNFMSQPDVIDKLFDVPNRTVHLELGFFQSIMLQCSGPEAGSYQSYYLGVEGAKLDFDILSDDPQDLSPSGAIEGTMTGLWGFGTAPINAAASSVSAQSSHIFKVAAMQGTLSGTATCIASAQGDIECEFYLNVVGRMINFQTGLQMGLLEFDFNIELNKNAIGWNVEPADGKIYIIPEVSTIIPTNPITPGLPGNTISTYDTDNDCELSDPEFFSLLDDWLSGSATDNLFFIGVDAWIGGGNVCSIFATTNEVQMRRSLQGLLIEAENALGSIQVFDTNGRLIYTQNASSNKLFWNMRNSLGQPVANGVYFVRVNQSFKPIIIGR